MAFPVTAYNRPQRHGAPPTRMVGAFLLAQFMLHSLLAFQGVVASNPIIQYRYSADPSAHVWPGIDRVYLYTSHDQEDAVNHGSMDQYYVYSSDDMVNWVDHGMVLHQDNCTWCERNMWAPDAAYRNGTFYLVFCAIEKATGMFRTGLAISDRPEGPFTDIGFIEGVEWGQDPSLFIDDDDEAYLFWGIGGDAKAARLAPDLRSIVPGSLIDLTSQLPFFYEGPWMHKQDGLYYLSYPSLYDFGEGERIEYATAAHPLGPFTSRGVIMDLTSAWTNHGSITKFRNQWYFFYHTNTLSGGLDHRRSAAVEYMYHAEDGSILPVQPTDQGVDYSDPVPGVDAVDLQGDEERLQQLAAEQTRQKNAAAGRSAWRLPGLPEGGSAAPNRRRFECRLCTRVLMSVSYIFQPFFGGGTSITLTTTSTRQG